MQTRSSSKFVGEPSTNPTSTNPKRRNRRRSKQRVEPFALEETPVVTMADQRTMAELLRAPTEGYAEAIVVPPIPAEHFELKHSLINLVTSKQFLWFEKEDPHAHIQYFNKITSTLKYKDLQLRKSCKGTGGGGNIQVNDESAEAKFLSELQSGRMVLYNRRPQRYNQVTPRARDRLYRIIRGKSAEIIKLLIHNYDVLERAEQECNECTERGIENKGVK
ncbi:hypothetical protein Tco_0699476 [Tanacetum coccineum]